MAFAFIDALKLCWTSLVVNPSGDCVHPFVASPCLPAFVIGTISAPFLARSLLENTFFNSIKNKRYDEIISLGKILIPFSLSHYCVCIVIIVSCMFWGFYWYFLPDRWRARNLSKYIFQSFFLITSCSHCKIYQPVWSWYGILLSGSCAQT